MILYAHRGLHCKTVDENSIASFSLAILNGYGIELDVRLSYDHVVTCVHDPVDDKHFVDLRSPSLEQALKVIDGRTPLLVEIKSEGKIAPEVAKVLDKYPHDNFAVVSFDHNILDWFRANRPNIPLGISYEDIIPTEPYEADFYCIDLPLMEDQVFDKPVISWTCKSQEDVDHAFRYGAISYMFDKFTN